MIIVGVPDLLASAAALLPLADLLPREIGPYSR